MIKKIKLNKEQIEFIKADIESVQDAATGFRAACAFKRITGQTLWNHIGKMFPDIGKKDASFDEKNFVISYWEDEEAEE